MNSPAAQTRDALSRASLHLSRATRLFARRTFVVILRRIDVATM